jgi:hypothetical protein
MAGIDTELRMREMAVGGNPQAAQQRYAQSKSLMDLLVAQKVSNDYASARNAMQAATQAPAGTVRDQLDMSNAQVTKNDMMRSVMPGVQMKAARDSQAMQRQAMGIPTQPAPNIRMRDGGIVGYKDGGLLDRIMNYIRSIEFGGTSDAADESRLSGEQKRIGRGNVLGGRGTGTPVTDSLGQMGRNRERETSTSTMPMPRPDDRAPRAAVSGPPTRAEQFSQMFPKAREYVNRGDGSAMGGLQYLQMVGRKQQEAKEEEARRAANYIKMLARSQDMIDEVDPANTLPPEITAFSPGGGVNSNVGRAYLDPETGEPLGLGARISRLLSGITGGLGEEELYQDPDAMSPQELLDFPSQAEIRRARYNVPEEERLTPQQLNAMTREEGQQRLINRALERRETPPAPIDVTKEQYDEATAGPARPKDEQKFITDPTLGDVLRQLQTGPVRPEEPEEKKGLFDNVDIGRLQAFLAGGGGQTSTAGALGGGLRGLMAEDQRREALASKEAIEAAKIASQRYGIEQDYNAALAKLSADNRRMLFEAQQTAIENYAKDDRKLAESMLDNLVTGRDEVFNRKMQDLKIEYGNNPDLLAAEMRAATNSRLNELMKAVRQTQGEVGAFDTDISETGAE